jgi:hypothetical protein
MGLADGFADLHNLLEHAWNTGMEGVEYYTTEPYWREVRDYYEPWITGVLRIIDDLRQHMDAVPWNDERKEYLQRWREDAQRGIDAYLAHTPFIAECRAAVLVMR